MRVRRSFVAAALSAVVTVLLVSCSHESATDDAPAHAKHLLLITVDALRADRLHCYGGRDDVSPAIDQLAADGAIFTESYAPMGMTLACLTTLMTSKYPDETGVTNNTLKINPAEVTLAERLTAAGFRSRGFVANGVLAPGHRSEMEQGFDGGYEANDNEAYLATKVRGILDGDFGQDSSKREFLWIHFMNPHQPYDPPPAYANLYDPNYTGKFDTSPTTIDNIFIDKTKLEPRDLEHILAVWDGQVRFVNNLIGSILESLKARGLDRDTLVVFTADHGEELYEHNCYFYHANSIYKSVTQVPLIVRQTGVIPGGTKVESVVESIDVLPTILGRLGVALAPDENAGTKPRGMSLEPALFKSGTLERSPFAFAQIASDVYAVRNKNWLYVENPDDFMPVSVPEKGEYPIARRALYDRVADPREQKNIIDQREDIANNMVAVLERWKSGLAHGTKLDRDLSTAEIEELNKLGYVGGKSKPPVKRKKTEKDKEPEKK